MDSSRCNFRFVIFVLVVCHSSFLVSFLLSVRQSVSVCLLFLISSEI